LASGCHNIVARTPRSVKRKHDLAGRVPSVRGVVALASRIFGENLARQPAAAPNSFRGGLPKQGTFPGIGGDSHPYQERIPYGEVYTGPGASGKATSPRRRPLGAPPPAAPGTPAPVSRRTRHPPGGL